MTASVFAAVLVAAFLHAGWNAFVKVGSDRFSSILSMALFQGGAALLLLPFFAAPAREAWPWVLLGSSLHTGYKLFLIRAYQHGDLSQVYPLARGAAPLMVAVASALFLAEVPGPARLAAIAAIGVGIMLMARSNGDAPQISRTGLSLALGTACFTAAYTMADGVGARLSGSPSGFILWMIFIDGLFMLAYALWTRGPGAVTRLIGTWRSGLAIGIMSLSSYWLVIWAFTKAPLALVAALRETSVLFAMLIAGFVLKERIGAWRWGAGALILAGIALMRF